MTSPQIKEMQHISDAEIVTLGNMAAKSLGLSEYSPTNQNCFNGLYGDQTDRWNIGLQCWTAAASNGGVIFTIGENAGVALCYPPGKKYKRALAGQFGEEDEKAEKIDPEHYKYLKEQYDPADEEISKAWPNHENLHGLHVFVIAIEPEKQGQGLGGALLRAICQKAEQLQCDVVLEADNESNVAFYKHMGFDLVYTGQMPQYQSEKTYARYCLLWQHKKQSPDVQERHNLTDDEIVEIGNMAAESHGTSYNPTSDASFGGTYADKRNAWDVGFRCWVASANANGLIFTIGDTEGVAICFPPGQRYDRSLAGGFGAKHTAAERADADFYEWKKTQFYSAQEAVTRAAWSSEESLDGIQVFVLAVARGKQGKGLGKALMGAVRQRAIELGCDIFVETDNKANVAFYEHMGYESVHSGDVPMYKSEQTYTRYALRWRNKQIEQKE